jgi:hypothetical protein
MKTTLIFKLKNKIRKFFGLRQLYQHPKKDITVRMDLLNHKVVDEERVKKLFNVSDIRDSIVDGKFPKTVKEEFNELPFSRLSEPAMREIIRIVRLDIENKIQKFGVHVVSLPDEGMLKKEMENTIK